VWSRREARRGAKGARGARGARLIGTIPSKKRILGGPRRYPEMLR
jgi:hypothetical protein